jgi:sulfate transport system ATP-binding protein
MSIEVRNITKRFGAFTALDDVSLRVESGELTAILGPSGSGKTSLLRVMAGLEAADAGEVHFFGSNVTGSHVRERGVGFVFQHYALFRHMSVFDNVAFGLTVRPRKLRPRSAEIKRRVDELLSLVQMNPHAHQFPSQLSGGQRQRVALARALALEPRVLLLDEPFGALDARVRAELRRWLRRLHDQVHVTSVFVTHDQEEALEVADRVVVLNQGRVEQIGPPADVYHAPANPFVCTFLGRVNIFRGRRTETLVSAGVGANGHVGSGERAAESSIYYVRPHEMDMVVDPALAGDTHVAGTVVHVNAAGPFVRVELQTTDRDNLIIDVPHDRYRASRVVRGDRVFAAPRDHRVFENGAGI